MENWVFSCLLQLIRTNSPHLINSSDNSSMRWTTVGALDSVASAMAEEMAWRLGQSLLWILFDLYGWRFWGICLFWQTWKMSKLTTPQKPRHVRKKGWRWLFWVEFQLDSTINQFTNLGHTEKSRNRNHAWVLEIIHWGRGGWQKFWSVFIYNHVWPLEAIWWSEKLQKIQSI